MPSMIQQHALSYTRFSSLKQSDGSSEDRQKALIGNWLDLHPDVKYHPDSSPSDLGVSGYSGRHLEAGLGDLLQVAESGRIGQGWYVLVEAYDRLGRLEPLVMINLLQQLINTGVTLVTLDDDREYSRESITANAGQLFMIVGKTQAAHAFSTQLSSRVKASYESRRQSAAQGNMVARRTLFFLDSQTGKLKYPEATVARELIELFLAGKGERVMYRHLRKELPDCGIKSHNTLGRMLRNRTCIGYWGETRMYEPLISEEVFYSIQQTFVSRARTLISTPSRFLLTGIVKCGVCGKNMRATKPKGRAARVVCGTRAKNGPEGCSMSNTIAYSALDWIRTDVQVDALERHANTQQQSTSTAELIVVDGKTREIQARIDNLLTVLEGQVSDALTKRLGTLETELDSLLSRRATLAQTAPTELSKDINDLTRMAMVMSDADLSRLLQKAGLVIYVYQDKSIEAEGRTYQYHGFNHRTGQYILTDESGEQIDLQQYQPKIT